MADSSDLQKYDVTVNGYETTMKLNPTDAEFYGATGDQAAGDAEADTTADASADGGAKARTVSNKARTAAKPAE